MKVNNNSDIHSFDEILDAKYGAPGTKEREEFDREAYMFCIGQMIHDARKKEGMTQSQLAEKVGATKSYISRIEKGLIEPGVALFFRIMEALGLRVDFVRPLAWSV